MILDYLSWCTYNVPVGSGVSLPANWFKPLPASLSAPSRKRITKAKVLLYLCSTRRKHKQSFQMYVYVRWLSVVRPLIFFIANTTVSCAHLSSFAFQGRFVSMFFFKVDVGARAVAHLPALRNVTGCLIWFGTLFRQVRWQQKETFRTRHKLHLLLRLRLRPTRPQIALKPSRMISLKVIIYFFFLSIFFLVHVYRLVFQKKQSKAKRGSRSTPRLHRKPLQPLPRFDR